MAYINKKTVQDRESLIIWIKYFSGLKISDKNLVWLLRDYFWINISERTIRKYKKKFNKNT